MDAVKLENVSFRYSTSRKKNLKKINLTIQKGEFVAIVGRNASGKTTLCNVIRGFVPHFYSGDISGNVYLNGKNVLESEISDLVMDAGYVFQNPFSQRSGIKSTVYEEIAFGLENMGLSREEIFNRVDSIVEMLQITHLCAKHPAELSGGQCQRVALASVIAMQPEVLIIDEPTSQLDPKGTEDVFKIIRKLKDMGKTIILVEHKIDRIAEYADRVIFLDQGEILLDGPTREVLTNPMLLEHGVVLPQYAMLGLYLREKGYDIAQIPVNLEDAKTCISQILQNGGR